jgi:hypothetical protein
VLLQQALATQEEIDRQWALSQQVWAGEKKGRRLLAEHISSIGTVVKQLGVELEAVEKRAQSVVHQGLQQMERQSLVTMSNVELTRQQQTFLSQAVEAHVASLTADQREFQRGVEVQLAGLRERFTTASIEISQVATAVHGAREEKRHGDASEAGTAVLVRELATKLEGLDERVHSMRQFSEHQVAEVNQQHRLTIEDVRRQSEALQQEFKTRMDAQFALQATEVATALADARRANAADSTAKLAEIERTYAGVGTTMLPVVDARLGQVSAELRELIAADRALHVEARKAVVDGLEGRLAALAQRVSETDQKLSSALSRVMDASGSHIKRVAASQRQTLTDLSHTQRSEVARSIAASEAAQAMARTNQDRRNRETLEALEIRVAMSTEAMEKLASYISNKQVALEEKMDTLLKTVVVV